MKGIGIRMDSLTGKNDTLHCENSSIFFERESEIVFYNQRLGLT